MTDTAPLPLREAAPADWARRLVASGSLQPLPSRVADRLAVAWALKDLCYAALNTEPQQAGAAAEALRRHCPAAHDEASASGQEILAVTLWTEGAALVTQGQMADALRSLDAAEAAFRQLGQDHHAAQAQVPKIIALSMQGRHADAAACAGRVQRELVAQGDRQAAGRVSLNLGNLNMRRDAYADAVRHYREATVLFARARDHEHSVMADIGLADALTATGDFAEALRIYARARMRAGQHALEVPQALLDESVALLDLARGHYREALAGFESSRRRYEHLAMPQNLAIAEKQLADAYLELHLLPEALTLLLQAQAKFEALDMRSEQAWALAQTGRVLARQGDGARADACLSQAMELFSEQHNGVGEAAVKLARAEFMLADGDAASAHALAAGAAEAFQAAAMPDGLARADVVRAHSLLTLRLPDEAGRLFDSTLEQARERQLLTVQVRCLNGQGLVAVEHGDPLVATQRFESAIELLEAQRRILPGDDLRSAFLTDHLQPYRELLRLALQDHARQATPGQAARVLERLDQVRARSLGDHAAAGPSGGESAEVGVLRARLHWLYRRTQRLDEPPQVSAQMLQEQRQVEDALLEEARRQRLAAPDGHRPAGAEGGFAAAALVGQLGDAEALVEYGVLDDELFACVVTARGVQVHRSIASWPEVLEALRLMHFQMETLRHGAAPVSQHLDTLARRAGQRLHQLHELVWAPLAGTLASARRVMVVPHAQLGGLPFAALHDGVLSLGERHALAVAASARMALQGLMQPPIVPNRVLALGESSRLPHAADEASAVAGLFSEGQACVGEQANLSRLVALAPQADLIHLACHALFRADNPMFSALHLADAALTVEQVEGLRLKPAMVVLSACETGLADTGRGDEAFGLVRAFQVAGAARVVASLWPVDDAVTASFMAAFYSAWRAGQSPAEALQAAQQQTRLTHPHPAYWAAFALHGGW